MTQTYRLKSGGQIDRQTAIRFSFNGKHYQGYRGDTLASALLANGVHFVARSWKYHRPRGIMTAGVDEPNALVQLEQGAYTVPNARATETELYDGLCATSVNASPSLERDRLAVNQWIARFIPAGFYYKTFKWPRSWWGKYEELIRAAAGFGKSPTEHDPDRYEKQYAHCDLLIVGAGPAGLAAALVAAQSGARVILADDQCQPGGSLLSCTASIDGQPGAAWIAQIMQQLRSYPELTILARSTVYGYLDHNFLTIAERLTEHLPLNQRPRLRERLWKVRAKRVILATGAHERPLVFGNNDLPGIMLASAISSYIHRYSVLPGRKAVIFTNNDAARPSSKHTLPMAAVMQGISVINNAVIVAASGACHVKSVKIASHLAGVPQGSLRSIACDVVGMSGGWNPVLHLFAQSGGKAAWHQDQACFVPGSPMQAETSVGAANGNFSLDGALRDGAGAAHQAVAALGFVAGKKPEWNVHAVSSGAIMPLWLIGPRQRIGRGPKQFVDYQNDVSAADIYLAAREGYHSVEHVKRYTALGFGTDQGKLGNINGMAILAEALGKTIPETGTTTFRPNYTPVTFGTIAGRELGDFLTPIRTTCIHQWHAQQQALFEDVGNWKRPWYYPRKGEDLHAAVARECLAVRNSVGILDASTLGKIDIQGADAVTLLNWMYTNPWNKLEVGKCRYGLMLDENGMVFDDGVTVRLGEQHFLMSTTTGGAARVLDWMERWLQTEWPHLQVSMTSVTDHFATFAVVGPQARKVLEKVCRDIDFSNAAFPFMAFREGSINDVFTRIMRISFSGELSYEVNVPANMGMAIWEALMEAGREFDITPYGTETMHVLRAEKGYIIVGQDTDGSVTPYDLGMGGLVAKSKDFLGKRSLARSDTAKAGRKQLVGLLTEEAQYVLTEGSQIVAAGDQSMAMIGHVTSSYSSPILKRSIAMAMVQGGLEKKGQQVTIPLASGRMVTATISSLVFYDKQGARQHVE